jgi:hypothetical protein
MYSKSYRSFICLSNQQYKKNAGCKSAFRVRAGNYRIGIVVENNTAVFQQVAQISPVYFTAAELRQKNTGLILVSMQQINTFETSLINT